MPSSRSENVVQKSDMATKLADLRVVARPRLSFAGESRGDAFDLHAVSADIDHMGHVNNAVYLSWVQDVVVKHWASKASDAELRTHLWIALKHEITYRRPAFLTDDLYATIIATGISGARAMFDTVIRRGDEVIADVKSVWCCLDASTRRPMRIARGLAQRFLVGGRSPLPVMT